MDREKEREIELESAMYTNCLLLGLDPAIIGVGGSNGTPRVGLFRHSNPKLGEQLLYFILSSLRGPIQSAKVQSLSHCLFFCLRSLQLCLHSYIGFAHLCVPPSYFDLLPFVFTNVLDLSGFR